MENPRNQARTSELIAAGFAEIRQWESNWPPFEIDDALVVAPERLESILDDLTTRLRENYPYFHPQYAGQMLKPPHPVAAAAYAIAQQINPNNHALDGGPATARMEEECIAALAGMFGYDPATCLGHLTSSGTIANLEALWVARQSHPGKAVAYSSQAHYTHVRMCEVIGVDGIAIPVSGDGRMDTEALETVLASGSVGTVVATAGTTGIGAVDPIDAIVDLACRYGVRVHADAAYGGFYRLLAQQGEEGLLSPATASALRSITRCDSVVIDPHKHGLQPYGCGAVLFRDAAIGRFYKHDSPYTYFTSQERHLGEISLECSRAGAAAAALWATLQCFPLERERGFGPIMAKTRSATQRWVALIADEPRLQLLVEPDLDIVTFYPTLINERQAVSEVSAESQRVFSELSERDRNSWYLALFAAGSDLANDSRLVWDAPVLTVLRSVLMKPEHLQAVPELHETLLKAL